MRKCTYRIHPYSDTPNIPNDFVETSSKVRNHRRYHNITCAFDIETTRLPGDQSIMYIWMFAIGRYDVYIGRTWEELEDFLSRLLTLVEDNAKLCVLVHNLSYEFCFLRTIYDFRAEEVFALKARRVAKCTMYDKLELRCTLIHSNMSLAEYTQKMGVEHVKLSGERYDYDRVRYPDTELSPEELEYCCHDVVGLIEAYEAEMSLEGDNLVTVPLTSTGYVRRDCRKAMEKYSPWVIRQAQPDPDEYTLQKLAFRGGDTHASRFYSGQILECVSSADRSSSYPDVMCNDLFPMGEGTWIKELSPRQFAYANNGDNCCYFARLQLREVKLKDRYWAFPYIPIGKCTRITGKRIVDNGRLLSADYIEICVTNVDFVIISETYDFKLYCPELLRYRVGFLPQPLIEVTQQYYRDKTELKNVDGQEVYYTKQKNKLNSLYGMSATSPLRMSYIYDPTHPNLFRVEDKDAATELSKNRQRNFLLYQWGCFVTAWARWRLYEAQRIAGDNAVYCDTDSIKYVGDCDFTEYNAERIARSTATKSFATDKHGVTHYMGVYEQERTYTRFITYGAKKYAYEYEDGRTHVTISGVSKKKGGEELHNRGGLEVLKEGFVFRDAGGVELVYNDQVERANVSHDGHIYTIGPNVCIRPSTYTLSLTTDYKELLSNPYLVEQIIDKFALNVKE